MVLSNYRHLLPRFVDGPVNFCAKHNITPNQISILGFTISSLAAVLLAFPNLFLYNYSIIGGNFWWWWFGIPPLIFFIGAYVDVLDGALARKTGQTSKFGGFLDSTLDRISDAVIVLGLLFSGMVWPWNTTLNNILCFVCLISMLMISYTRSRAELEGVVMKGIGFLERPERVFMLLFAYLIEWIIFAVEEFFLGGREIYWFFPAFFVVFTILCIQTFIARVLWAEKWLNGKMPDKVEAMLAKEAEAKAKQNASKINPE